MKTLVEEKKMINADFSEVAAIFQQKQYTLLVKWQTFQEENLRKKIFR